MEPETLALTLPIRRLVEFLLRTGSIDSRFTGFDRALEGARLHRKLQRAAVKEFPDYQAEVALRQQRSCAGVCYTLEGRADGVFTDTDRHDNDRRDQDHNAAAGAYHRRAKPGALGAGTDLCSPPRRAAGAIRHAGAADLLSGG